MARCLQLAEQGLGSVAPNPLVGCVIVHESKIIGEGYHKKYGGPHAEVNAIHQVQDESLLENSVLYVNLEPCAHYGKTPPCVDLIIEKGIPSVVIGSMDPYKEVSGRGIEKLRNAGVNVLCDVLFNECRILNRRFFTFQEKKRPYIILKWAQTRDGFMDRNRLAEETGINWITGPFAKRMVHEWRSEESAILVGKNTILRDNPSLTVREVVGKNPQRIVLDSQLELLHHHTIFNDSFDTIVVNEMRDQSISEHVQFIKVDSLKTSLMPLMNLLYQKKIESVLVEGGRQILDSFISQGLWDESRVFIGSTDFGDGLLAPLMNFQNASFQQMESDTLRILYNLDSKH